jgi:hypothetical protein
MDSDDGYTVRSETKIALSPRARREAWESFPHLEKHEAEKEMAKFLLNRTALRRAGIIQ